MSLLEIRRSASINPCCYNDSEKSVVHAIVHSVQANKKVRRMMAIELPEEYKRYLVTGLTEGGLAVDPGWYQLWPLDRVAEYNKGYQIEEFAPGFLAFGSSGGGEIFAFDAQHRIYMIPAIGMSPEEAELVAETWQDFERAIER